ncbi:cytochrome P450 [Mycena rosella]|uniref:Cytochrome P450 n=1 Tax=Mycena rosella TaxID=1033263 RepID=A0AAD7DU66_MYCRO|nr:cytochrome P450 [Mycena rosella]
MLSQILWPMAGTTLCYVLFQLVQLRYRDFTSPLCHVVGPKNPSFLGNFRQMANDAYLTDKWRNEFGNNFRFRGLFSSSELYPADIKAINHIVTRSLIYRKAPFNLENSNRITGRGRRIIVRENGPRLYALFTDVFQNPAFGLAQIRLVTEVFVEKVEPLFLSWRSRSPPRLRAPTVAQENGAARIEVLSWLRRETLDVIGQAGFNYQFNALHPGGEQSELEHAFTDLFHSPHAQRNAAFRLAEAMVPILIFLVGISSSLVLASHLIEPKPGMKVVGNARNKMRSKASVIGGDVALGSSRTRDLLSILLKANISKEIPESQRLTDAEVMAQIPTFVIAGHETTSAATAWALHALSSNRAAQNQLRDEVFTISTDNPTMELNSLPYLEMVRETMRVCSPVVYALPLGKPYIDKSGKAHDSLPIRKGQVIHVPILAINTDKNIWGPDAGKFRSFDKSVPDAASQIPSIWVNLLTFYAGTHNCIGFRFAFVEMKALLFTLICVFELEPAVPEGGIGRIASLLQRPTVLAEAGKGSQFPMIGETNQCARFVGLLDFDVVIGLV